MRATRRRRGFTLAELLVGLVVTSIVMVAVVAIFVGVQRSYQAETEVKVITENGRGALLFIERVLPLAGYGIDPRVAFDVGTPLPVAAIARDNVDVQTLTFSPVQPAMAGNVGTIVTDDLAFRFRDPTFLRAGRINTGNTSVTVDTALGVGLPVGKMLMVSCRGSDSVMVRVATAALATDTSISVSVAGAPFSASSATCLQATGASSPWVFLVQEHRLRIVNLGGRPWLVSFRNLEADVNNVSLDNFDPIAPDVESFQVAFGMNRARPGLACCQAAPDATGNSNFIVGDVLLENVFAQPAGVLNTLPDYRTGYDRLERYQAHPANIRSVHVALVLRSTRAKPDGRREQPTGDLFNYDATPTPVADLFRRSLFFTAVNTPNLMSRSTFTPALRSSADTRDLNAWGG